MFSRIRERLTRTAAWRLSLGPTLVFAAGTTVALIITYFIAARSIREHNDAWLHGEVEVLRQVSLATPQGQLYPHIVRAIAESAMEEVTGASRTGTERARMIFFLHTDATGRELVWLGPRRKAPFISAVVDARLPADEPRSIYIPGHRLPFRVVKDRGVSGTDIYLGLSDVHADHVRDALLRRLAWVWFGGVGAGWVMSFAVARRMLRPVESITRTAAGIRSDDLSTRVPEGRRRDEISRLARTLNGMLDRIAGSVNEVRSLTDIVAHELKSPLTAIRGRLEVALTSEDDARCREATIRALDDLDRLATFVTTTLDVAEADAGGLRLRRERVDFAELVRDLVSLYEPAFGERGQAIRTDLPERVIVEADASLIGRTVANLLDNELHHAPANTTVALSMAVAAATVTLRIDDDGPGFSSDLLARMFRRFGKGPGSGGHGLGLAFVRATVLAHGGDVAAGNRAGGGAFVEVTLPLPDRRGD